MVEKTAKASVEDILSDVSERLKRVNENLRKLREGGQDGPHAGHVNVTHAPQAAAPKDGPAVDGWAERLRGFSRELDALNSGTEGDFLFLGASLQEFYRRAKKAAETSSTVAHAVSDKEVEKTIGCLSGLLDKMRHCLDHSESETVLLVERLGKVSDGVVAAQASVTKGSEIFAKMSVVHAKVRDAADTVQRLRSKNRQKAGTVIDNASQGLLVLREKHDRSVVAIQEISTLSAKITKAMGEVVESLQFHDITRQRVEHVSDSIEALAARLQSAQAAGHASQDPIAPLLAELVPAAGDECEFQAEQLSRSRDELCYAVDVICENLRDLATSTAAVSEETSILTKGDAANAKSFLTSLGGWLSSASCAFPVFLEEYEASLKAASAARDAAETARELCGLLGHADKGEEGCMTVADLILASLATLGETCEKDDDSEPFEGPADFKRMGDELAGMLNSLRCLNGKVLYSLNLIDDAGRTLSEDIEKAVKAIVVHDRFKGVVDLVGGGLLDITANARAISPATERSAGRAALRAASPEENRGIWRAGLTPGYSGPDNSEEGREDEFGENVELF